MLLEGDIAQGQNAEWRRRAHCTSQKGTKRNLATRRHEDQWSMKLSHSSARRPSLSMLTGTLVGMLDAEHAGRSALLVAKTFPPSPLLTSLHFFSFFTSSTLVFGLTECSLSTRSLPPPPFQISSLNSGGGPLLAIGARIARARAFRE